jgi:HJR/Mrr/RecB family endonuclease
MEWWKELTGQQFEEEFASLLIQKGYKVTHTGGRGDEGCDLLLDTKKGRVVVQCKAHNKVLGPAPVRELLGSMQHHNANEGWLVGIEGFSQAAHKFAANKAIKLLVIGDFL